MSSSARFFAVILISLLCVPVCSHAQSAAKATTKTPRGTVSGRVTVKHKPAPGLTVGLRQTGGMMPTEKVYKGVTDHEGFYRITNVPPGTYDINTVAPAYVAEEATYPRGKSVIVGEDEEVDDINFSLMRGGVITGKVTDAEGRPIIQQQVSLYRAGDFQEPVRQVFPAGNVQTDDRGIYRFFGLAPGRYKVACGRGGEIYVNTYTPSRINYKQVFHPDVTDQTRATIIDVREGSEATNVDISLGSPVQTFTVSGRVIEAEKGLPVPNIRLAFQRTLGDRFEMTDHLSVSNSSGDFVGEGMAPGKYAVLLYPMEDRELRAEAMWFDVVDQDVAGLTVKLIKGSTISGVVVLESEDKKVFAKLLELHLRAYVTAPAGAPMVAQSNWSTISSDGTFRLGGLSPGRVNLWLTLPRGGNPPKGFAMTRVEHNGVVLPRGLEIKDGEQLEGVRVFVNYGTATVRGAVSVEKGPLPDGSRMFVRLLRPGTPPALIANTLVDARGQFLLEGVPAGVYELVLTTVVLNSRPPAPVKREISVQDGVVTEVSLTLDPTPPAKP